MKQAKCARPEYLPSRKYGKSRDIFFPEKGDRKAINKAAQVCLECPVRKECNAHGILTGAKHGVWAGKSKA